MRWFYFQIPKSLGQLSYFLEASFSVAPSLRHRHRSRGLGRKIYLGYGISRGACDVYPAFRVHRSYQK
jgi:hypothetical protein